MMQNYRRAGRAAAIAAGVSLVACATLAQAGSLSGPEARSAPVENGVNVAGKSGAAVRGTVAEVALAFRQADQALEAGDADALISAIRQIKAAGESGGDGLAKGRESSELEPKAGDSAPRSVDDLVVAARKLAGDDAQLLARVAEVDQSSERGRVGGPRRITTQVLAYSNDNWNMDGMWFSGGQLAEVGIVGDGDTDLDLYVYDENANLICRSESYSDTEYCSWEPSWTGPFLVIVRNLGPVWNEYMLLTN